MTRLVAAELLKLRTTRTFWWFSFVAVALPVLVVVITLATSDTTTQDDARSLLSNIGIAGLFMLILGVVGAAGEYRHGTVTSTFLVAPERRRVLVAKAIAHGIAGLGAGAVATIMILAISVPWLSSQGHAVTTLDLSAGDVAAIAAGSIIYAALGAMLGVAAGVTRTEPGRSGRDRLDPGRRRGSGRGRSGTRIRQVQPPGLGDEHERKLEQQRGL